MNSWMHVYIYVYMYIYIVYIYYNEFLYNKFLDACVYHDPTRTSLMLRHSAQTNRARGALRLCLVGHTMLLVWVHVWCDV